MTEIYVIRHVQAEGNLYRLMQGQWDGSVTELGRRQWELLSMRFRNVPVDAVYSSDLRRAYYTASAVTRFQDVPILIDKRLREINTGPWEGVPFANLQWDYPEQFYNFMHKAEDFRFEGAETFMQVQQRMVAALTDIAAANPGRTIAVASHGVAIRCLLTGLMGLSLNDTEAVPIFVNTGVARLLYEDGKFTVDYINDSSHLGDMPPTHATISVMFRDEAMDPRENRDYYTACYRGAWEAVHGDLHGFDPESYYLAAVEHHRYDSRSVLKIYYDSEPVGLLDMDSAKGSHADYGWVSLIYLKEEYRHRGYGVQLIGRAIAKYDLMGRKAVRLLVSEANTSAIGFYRKYGFRELSYQNGAGARLLLMEKPLRGTANGNV